MTKIYELTPTYSIVRKLVTKALGIYYDEIHITGIENIPTKGGFLIAPNHRNALMDALAVARIIPTEKSTLFLARSDLFKNKLTAKVMRFAKILPAFRIRDGYENLGKNKEVFEECIKLLEANQAMCIMPEGNQELAHKVRPLVKGIFRIAFLFQQRNFTEQPIQIVPVGLDYGSLVKFGKHLIINIGKPIDVSEYSKRYADNPPRAIQELRNELRYRLEQLILHIDSDKHYETILSLTKFSQKVQEQKPAKIPAVLENYQISKKLADKLCEIEKEQPEVLDELENLVFKYKKELEKNGIQSRNVEEQRSATKLFINAFALIFLFPVAIIGFIMNMLPFFMPVWIRRVMKVEFEGFFSSVQFVLGLVLFPIFYSLQSLLICHLLAVSLFYSPILFVTHYFVGKLSFKYYGLLKGTTKAVRYNLLPHKEQEKLEKLLQEIRDKLSVL